MSVKKQRPIQIPFGIVHHFDVEKPQSKRRCRCNCFAEEYVIYVSFEEQETQQGLSRSFPLNGFWSKRC